MQPYALRAPEVTLGLEWGPAIDIWSLGCLVSVFLLTSLLCTLLITSPKKMYELATGHWLFNPKTMDDIPRDIVHLAQMTRRTGQEHDDVTLKQYEIRKKQPDLKGKEMHPHVLRFIHLGHLQAC